MDLPGDLPSLAARGAGAIHRAFDEHHRTFRAITGRVRRRFEERDWEGIRRDTVEKLELPSRSLDETIAILRGQLGDRLCDRGIWGAMKAAYTREILGRDDFEIAQTYFNSLTRKVFPRDGVDPALDYTAGELPVPFQGWEMASARVYAVRRVDAGVIRRVLEDAGFETPFRDLGGDAALAAERLEQGIAEAFGGAEIDALDVLRPVFFRNKGAYLVGRVRRGEARLPVVLALVNHREGIEVDAVLHTEDETSIVFSFARWYFHVDVASPREVIGFLRSILPRKRDLRALHLPRLQEARQDRALPRPDGAHRPDRRPLRPGAGSRRPGDGGLHAPLLRVRVQDHQGRFPAAEEHHAGAGDGEVPHRAAPRPCRPPGRLPGVRAPHLPALPLRARAARGAPRRFRPHRVR